MARPSDRGKRTGAKSRSTSVDERQRARLALGAVVIAGASVFVYLPSLEGDFILDDDTLLVENSLVRSPDGLYKIWFTTEAIDYWPVTNTSFWLQWRLWGANPTGYHVTNLVLHVASALLVWRILSRLSIPWSWLGALLFAVHPLNVESVAWIAQRKNTLSMLFFLLSILWYLTAESRRHDVSGAGQGRAAGGGWWYSASLLAFFLAMLSKGSVATLPVMLMVILWWRHGRVSLSDAVRLVPFFVVAVALAVVNVWFQTHGSGQEFRSDGLVERLLGAGAVIWFYLYKTVLPFDLSFVYPQWTIDSRDIRWWLPLVASVGVTGLLVWQCNTRWGRPVMFAWLIFCAALVPVMGFTDVGFMQYSLVADRYAYIAIVAPLALAAAGLAMAYRSQQVVLRRTAMFAAAAASVACLVLAREQGWLYADAVVLYEDTLQKNPGSWLIHNNLALRFKTASRFEEAAEHLEQSLRLNNEYPHAQMNLGNVLVNLGRLPDAIAHLERARELSPESSKVHYNLGFALERAGRGEEAIASYQRALELSPNYLEAHQNLAAALAGAGRSAEAVQHYEAALTLNPSSAEVRNNLASELMRSGRRDEGIAELRKTLAMNPKLAEVHFNLANALMQAGQAREAISHFRQAIQLKPDFLLARYHLGTALADSGQPEEAVRQFLELIESQPGFLPARTALMTTYAAINRPAEAVATAEETIDLARSSGQTEVAQRIAQWLSTYRAQFGGGTSPPLGPAVPAK